MNSKVKLAVAVVVIFGLGYLANAMTTASISHVVTADLDGKGKLDIIIARNGTMFILKNNGDQTFTALKNPVKGQ